MPQAHCSCCQLALTHGSCVPTAPGTSFATTPCYGTALTLPGWAPECPEHREAPIAAHAHTTHHLQQLSSAPNRHGAGPVPHPRLVPALVPSPGHCIWEKKALMNNLNNKNKHGEQAGNLCPETCCLQEGGQTPPPKPAGYICGPLSWGLTTYQGLPKQSTAIRSSCTGRRVCLCCWISREKVIKTSLQLAESSIDNRNSQGLNRAGEDLHRRNSICLVGVTQGLGWLWEWGAL